MSKFFGYIAGQKFRLIVGGLLFAEGFVAKFLSLPILSAILFCVSLAIAGVPVMVDAVQGILRGDLLDEKFLMSIATVGAVILGEFSEGAAVMLFYLVGETFEGYAVTRSRKSIRSLMDIRPDEARVLIDGVEELTDAEDVAVGSEIVIRPGERVPIDCVVLSGNAYIDTSALTGESLPRPASPATHLASGSVVLDGVLNCRTERTADASAAARILDMVENANERKSKTEAFITKFSHYYTPAVVALAVLVAVVPLFFGVDFRSSVMRALTCLVVSCPCALLISVPLSFFGGIGAAAARGILYKGGSTFSDIANADTVAFDKTGTLTRGSFTVSEIKPVGVSADVFRRLAASAEYGSNHPIAAAVRSLCADPDKPDQIVECAGKGVIASFGTTRVAVGNAALMQDFGVTPTDKKTADGVLYVARDGIFIGSLTVSDTVRDEAASAISELRSLGVRRTVMLSGDRKEIAEKIGGELGLDEVRAELLPEEKYAAIDAMIAEKRGPVVYVGDGINDAPGLVRADVGIAMGAIGSDSAIESADAVIMSDDLSKIAEAIRIAHKTLRISKENIAFALGVKIAVLALSALGVFGESLMMYFAVFADVGVAVLAILNAMRTLHFKKS